MADEVDVESTIVAILAAGLYPNGTGQASAAAIPCKIYRGWPTTQLQQLAEAVPQYVNVTISTRNGVETNVSRRPFLNALPLAAPVHTLTATVNDINNTITIGGTVATPQNIMVLIGGGNLKSSFVYAVQPSDTLTTIATGLANAIAVGFPGTVNSGPVITVNIGLPLEARVTSSAQVWHELKRQQKSFQVSIWAPPSNVAGADPDAWRTAVINIVDPLLAGLVRIVLPDQQWAHIWYERSIMFDLAQMQGLYRRDLFYWVEYATSKTFTAYEIGDMQSRITGAQLNDGELPATPGIPSVTNNS